MGNTSTSICLFWPTDRRWRWVWLAAMCVCVSIASSPSLHAAPPAFPAGLPFPDMLQQMFGGTSKQQRDELAKVRVSPSEQRQFGTRAAQAYIARLRREGTKVVERGRDVKYLQSLVRSLKPQMRNARQYPHITIYVADAPKTDARSFPGGTLIVFRGMIDFAGSEAALACILGHELSHMDHGHQLLALRAWKLAQSTWEPGNGPKQLDQMMHNGMLLGGLFAHPFRPEQEAEADLDGTTWAYRSGYDPREFAKMFLRLRKRDGKAGDAIPLFFRSHPSRPDRFEAVMRRYKHLQATEPRDDLKIGRENLKRRTLRRGR